MIDLSYTNKDGVAADNTKFVADVNIKEEPVAVVEDVVDLNTTTDKTKKSNKKKTDIE